MKNRIRLIIVMLLFLGLASVVSPTCMIPADPSQQSSVPIQQHVLSEAEEFVYCIDEPGTHYVDPALTPREDYGYHENYDGGGLHTAAGYTILTEYQWLTNDYLDLTYHIQNIPEGYEDYALQIYMSAWENPENLGVWVDTDLSGTPSDLGEISSVGLFSYNFGPWFGSDIYVSLIGAVGLGLPVTKWHITYLRLHCHGVASDPESVTCDAIFDTDNIYAYHGAGTNTYADFCCTIYDADGYDSVESVQMSLLTAGSSLIWAVNWDSSSGFSITYGSTSIALDPSSYSTHSGLYRRVVHFYVIIKWAHSDHSETKVELGANYKVESETYNHGWDIRTELAFLGLPQLETPRCDPSASVDFTGRLKYADSNTHLAPLSNGVDIVPKRTSPSSWTGSTYGVDSSGHFAAACDATSSLGVNDFTLHVYGEGTWVDLLTATDTIRVSEIIAYNEGCNDDLINVGTDATTIYTYLRYDDGSPILGAVSCTWSGITLTHAGSGQWTGTSNSRSTPGTTSYTHLVIQTIHGVSYVQTHPSVTITHDEITIQSLTTDDVVVNPGDSVEIRITAQLAFTNTWLGSGDSITLFDGTTYYETTWDSDNSWFDCLVSSASSDQLTYTVTSAALASEGITALDTNDKEIVISYDVVEVVDCGTIDSDGSVDIGSSHTIWFTARLHYTGTVLGSSDSLSINGVIATWQNGHFEATFLENTVCLVPFTMTSASQASEGITSLESSPTSINAIWNTLMVDLLTNDSHVTVDDTVRVWAHVTRAYDGSVVTSGTVILRHSTSSDLMMVYSVGDELWYVDVSQSDLGQFAYYIYSISDSMYGLTTVGRGTHFDGSNGYVNCGSDSSLDLTSSLSLSVWFYGDGSNWGSGMYILAKKDNNNAQYSLYVHSDGTLKFVYYNGALREIDLQAVVTRNTWHQVVVTISGTALNCWYDGSHVQNDLTLPASLVSFSSVPLYLGAQKSGAGTGYHLAGFISEARIYNTTLSDVECELLYLGQYPETSNLRLLLDRTSFDAADGVWYDLSNSTNDGALNQVVVTAGSIPMSSDEVVRPIWDQIKVVGYTSDNPDIDVGTASSCHVTLQYALDGRPVEDGAVTVNGVAASPSTVLGVWNFSEIKSSAQGVIYDSMSYSGGAYGLSSVDQNSQTITQVWEQILVLTTTVVDSSIDVGTPAEVRVMARLTYHSSHSLGASDDLYMNGVKMSWSGSYFYYRPTQSDVGLWNYYVNTSGALEDTYGISAINVTGLSVDITWTGLIIDITDPAPQWVNVGENASGISISVTYAHNGAPYDGTVNLNSTQFIYSDAGRRGFRLLTLTGDDALGITYVITGDETWCIWDGVIITITDPTHQTLIVGQNASGIVVSACYAYDGQPFDGAVQLNNTQFEYLTPGRRGYTVSSILGGSRGIDAIVQNDETFAVWVLQQAVLHLKAVATSVLVSTLYDPRNFSVDVCLTNTDLNMIPGWVNLTINGEDYAVYCDGMINATFGYSPITSGQHTLQAVFGGDSVYAATDTSLFLTATSRDIVFVTDLPTEMIPMTPASFRLFNVYDNDFQGQFRGVTYNRDYPVNTSFSIWWTLSSDYGDPKNHMGTWDINVGEGTGQVTVPWDLDGDNRVTSDDFTCYFIIYLDGLGIYENITVETPVNVLQPLEVILQVPALTYSDQATLSLQLRPLYDSSSMEHLDLNVALYVSDDNSSWVLIAEVTTTASGWIGVNWTCIDSGTLFFKVETTTSEFYIESRGHAVSAAGKETTTLTIECVGNFTYSDQGVLVALFSTDDGEPLSDYSVYLEIMDGTWVSIGSALTNGSGQASILWIPTLPAGTYSIQLRMLLAESQYYVAPENAMGQLVVGKEFIVISIDSTAAAQGYVRARVTDDDGNPVESIQVDFYVGNNHDYRGSGITDTDGYARLNITLNDGELLQAVVNENNYFYGASQEVTVVVPMDLLFLTAVAGIVFLSAAGLAVTRKILRGRAATGPKPASPELREALEEERDSIPERVREHTERRIAELDEVSHGAEETSELSSTTEPGSPHSVETGTEGDSD